MDDSAHEIEPDVLLKAYAMGMFPMAESAGDPAVFWVRPETRGIIPLDAFHAPKSLLKTVRRGDFDIAVDADFDATIAGCAEATQGRPSTWINSTIRSAYRRLFDIGHCHTVEARRQGRLVGGLYGVSLGGAFFGESMFSRETDASKVCLVHLVRRLRAGGFVLLDTQFTTDHLKRFGAIDVPRRRYERLLGDAVNRENALFA